jgi:hypothetical protein
MSANSRASFSTRKGESTSTLDPSGACQRAMRGPFTSSAADVPNPAMICGACRRIAGSPASTNAPAPACAAKARNIDSGSMPLSRRTTPRSSRTSSSVMRKRFKGCAHSA